MWIPVDSNSFRRGCLRPDKKTQLLVVRCISVDICDDADLNGIRCETIRIRAYVNRSWYVPVFRQDQEPVRLLRPDGLIGFGKCESKIAVHSSRSQWDGISLAC